jgi:hypothetical protein
MIRKLLVVAAAAAIPMSMVAVGAIGSSPAFAGKTVLPSPPISCSVSGTVTFAPPGISHNGSVGTGKTSTTNTSTITFAGPSCGPNATNSGGSTPPRMITSKSSKCAKTPDSPVPGCVKGDTYFDTASSYVTTGASTLQKALKKGTITLDGVGFPFKTSSAVSVDGGACGAEAGFQISGSVKNKAYAYTTYSMLVCLGGDTGTGTTGAFLNDITTAIASSSGPTIASATIDPSSSVLTVG